MKARPLIRGLLKLVGGLLLLLVLWQGGIFAQVLWWSQVNPASTRFMRIQLEALRAENPDARLRHQWVDYERISVHLKRAVVAAEDDRFLDHAGFDWTGIQHALERNRRRGAATAGGSTISQQLAKNLFLTPTRSYLRKAQEAVITVMIETTWSKRRILEVYLNVAEWGTGVFGSEAAAQRFFGISADRLGPAEAANLAVRLPNPRRYEQHFGPAQRAHAARVAARMGNSRIP